MCQRCERRKKMQEKLKVEMTVEQWVLIISSYSIMRNVTAAVMNKNMDMVDQLLDLGVQAFLDLSDPEHSVQTMDSMTAQLGDAAKEFMLSVPDLDTKKTVDLEKVIREASEVKELERMHAQNGKE